MILYHFETKKKFRKILKNFKFFTFFERTPLWAPAFPIDFIMAIDAKSIFFLEQNFKNQIDAINFSQNSYLTLEFHADFGFDNHFAPKIRATKKKTGRKMR